MKNKRIDLFYKNYKKKVIRDDETRQIQHLYVF